MSHGIRASATVTRHPPGRKPKLRKWDLLLYIAGKNKTSAAALRNLQTVCELQLKGKYHIRVVDLLLSPRQAREHHIVAVPTLMRVSPLPVRSIIGDLSNTERLMAGLDLLDDTAIRRL